MFYSSKRILSLYMLFTLCFMAIMVRIVYINRSAYSEAGRSNTSRTVTVGITRGKIYDRNGELLVDSQSKLTAAVTPVAAAKKYLPADTDFDAVASDIEKGYPFLVRVEKEIDNELVKTFPVPLRYSESDPACHIVGYVNSEGKGVTGVEKAYDELLSGYGGRLSVSFEADALGRVLAGMDKIVRDDNFNSRGGVMLTLDKRIQQLTEKALEESTVESGCAIVMEAHSGDIVALASVPVFDRNRVEQSLDGENSPLVNKALASYSAGSVFKSFVAAFALESGVSEDFTVSCEGKVTVGDKVFTCYGETAHGEVNMEKALQKSCNIYFIRLMEKLDAEKFLSFCSKIGFGEGVSLCDGIEGEKGLLPSAEALSLEGNRANFAFGQGDLLVTPLQAVKAYHVIATGNLIEPRLIYGFCDGEGNVVTEGAKEAERVLSEETVEKMRAMLHSVTEKGIATNAKSEVLKLAGKTGTAESGVYGEEGQEVYRTWFAGFYPADEPEYIVAVMNEDGVGGNADCAPVFKEICEGIEESKGE